MSDHNKSKKPETLVWPTEWPKAGASVSADTPRAGAPNQPTISSKFAGGKPAVSSDLPGKPGRKKPGKGKVARRPKGKWGTFRSLLLCTTICAGGYYGYDQHTDDYQKEWLGDLFSVETQMEKRHGFIPASLNERYRLGQYVPDDYMEQANSHVELVNSMTMAMPGYEDVDFNTEPGRMAAYQKTLQSLWDFDNPLIMALQNTENHATEEAAIDYLTQTRETTRASADNERVSVNAAVFLSLKLGGHDEYAAQAYERLTESYEKPTILHQSDNARIERAALVTIFRTEQQLPITVPRSKFSSEKQASYQHEKRAAYYQTAGAAILQQMDIPEAPVILANQQQLNELMPETPKSAFNGVAQANPFKISDEAIAINYDDRTLERSFWTPRLNTEPEVFFDAHNYKEVALSSVARGAYEIDAQRHAEKFLMGYSSYSEPEYGYGVAIAIDKIAEYSGMDVGNSTLSKTADGFSDKFLVEFDKQTRIRGLDRIGRSAVHKFER